MVDHDADTISTMLEGNQLRDLDNGIVTTFNAPEVLGQNLKDIGVDVLTTANNHCMDKGYSGLVSTLDELDKVGLSHTGTYRSVDEQNTILTKEFL